MGTLFGGAGPWFLGWIGTIALAAAGWQRSVRLTRAASALGRNFQEARDQAQRSAEAERRTRRLVEAQPDFMVRRDANGRITFANAGYARLAGAPAAALMGAADRLKVAEAGPIRTRPDGVRLIDEAVATGEGLRWIAWTETDLVEPEGAREVLRIGREITDRVVSERAVSSNSVVGPRMAVSLGVEV